MERSEMERLVQNRHDLISGGAHTYSKGDDQFPINAPKVIVEGRGAYVWADDGNKYLDWTMGLRSVSLGHSYEAVNRAVRDQIEKGNNFGRPSIVELELADILVNTLPNSEMVKFGKNGSTVTTAAVKLARAYTGRKYVAVCKDHPFFSYDDWFIGTTNCNSGIPDEIKGLTLTFSYNNIDSLTELFVKYPGQIAGVIMEVATTVAPENDFLNKVQAVCRKNGTIFILDEMRTGFRWGIGAQNFFNLQPDLSCYGKGIANGYSLAVLTGRKNIMNLGGIHHEGERVFLVSTTHGAENISIAAAIATIKEMREKCVIRHFWAMGTELRDRLLILIQKNGLGDSVKVLGYPPDLSMDFRDRDGRSSMELRTIMLQELIRRRILFQGYFAVSFSHKEREIQMTIDAFEEAMACYKKAWDRGDYRNFYDGPAVKPVFRKFN